MIETLESRQLFSSTAHDALVALRVQWGNLSRPLGAIMGSYNNQMTDVMHQLSKYNAPTTNASLVKTANTAFVAAMEQLASDIKITKIQLNADSIHLSRGQAFAAAHPTNPNSSTLVANDESLLVSQASASRTAIGDDCAILIRAFNVAAGPIVLAHPVDSSLINDITKLVNKITSSGGTIQATMTEIVTTAVPTYIAAVVPGTTPTA